MLFGRRTTIAVLRCCEREHGEIKLTFLFFDIVRCKSVRPNVLRANRKKRPAFRMKKKKKANIKKLSSKTPNFQRFPLRRTH